MRATGNYATNNSYLWMQRCWEQFSISLISVRSVCFFFPLNVSCCLSGLYQWCIIKRSNQQLTIAKLQVNNKRGYCTLFLKEAIGSWYHNFTLVSAIQEQIHKSGAYRLFSFAFPLSDTFNMTPPYICLLTFAFPLFRHFQHDSSSLGKDPHAGGYASLSKIHQDWKCRQNILSV